MQVTFTSKDPVLDRHYERTFGERFTADANRVSTPDQMREMQEHWHRRMLEEAEAQEHYDFTVDDHGIRHVIRDEDGSPKLLVPEVRVF